jgi:O-antigen ligase
MMRLPFFPRLDIPFAVMGLFFVAMAVSEYLLPGGAGGDRLPVRILCGAQTAFALMVVFFSHAPTILSGRMPISFLLLFIWLCVSGITYTDNKMMEAVYLWVMYLYWYSLFLFFYIRSRAHPERLQMFIVLAVCSLLVWVPALLNFTRVNVEISNTPVYRQAQNYAGYYIVALFPYALLLKRKTLKIIAIALISYGAVYSLKRGVILALILMGFSSSLLYYTIFSNVKKKGKNAIAIIALWAIAISAGLLFVRANPEAVSRRLKSDTGRSGIYAATLEAIAKADYYLLVIGHGNRQSLAATGHEPHNDWLLLLYDYGIVGVIIMLNIYSSLISLLLKLCKLKSPLAIPLVSVIVLMACVQFYSTGLYVKIFGFITGGIGIIVGRFYGEPTSIQNSTELSRSRPLLIGCNAPIRGELT